MIREALQEIEEEVAIFCGDLRFMTLETNGLFDGTFQRRLAIEDYLSEEGPEPKDEKLSR